MLTIAEFSGFESAWMIFFITILATYCPDLGSFLISRAVSGGWMLEASYTHDLVVPAGFEPCAADHEVERFARFSAREVLDLIAARKVMHEAASSLLFSMAATPSAAD